MMFLFYYARLLFSTSVSALSLLGMAFQILVVCICMYVCISYTPHTLRTCCSQSELTTLKIPKVACVHYLCTIAPRVTSNKSRSTYTHVSVV